MKFFKAIGGFAKKMWSKVVARYEAAYWNFSGDRTYINSSVQDARMDADFYARTEILRKARYFEQNNAIVNRLVDIFEQFTVGAQGLQVIPDSSDEKWNQRATASWRIWCKYPDLVSRQYFGCLQSIMARRWFIDGEIFIHKVASPNSNKPRLRLYESHRCYTPRDLLKEEGKTVIDGVGIDAIGRPTGYWIHRDQKDETTTGFDFIKADEIIHLFEPERPGMYRGMSFLYPVLNDIHDLDDIQMYEKRAAKDASEITNVVKTASGEVDANTYRKQRMSVNTQDSDGNVILKRDDQYYKSTLGGRTLVIKRDEDITQFQSERPSVAQQSFWDYLLAKICAGVGISKLFVVPFSMQGTVTRLDADISTIFFRSRSSVIGVVILEIYEWYMGSAKDFDKTLGKSPLDWFKARLRPPKAANVDTGRNSSAMISEYQAGLRTAQDIYGELGEDWREQFRQRAEEKAFALSLIQDPKFEGVTVEDIINPTGIQPMAEPDADDSEKSNPDPEMRFQLT